VEVLRTLPKQAFWPMPTIESSLVRMTRDNQLGDSAAEMGRFIHQLFASRRKTLRNALVSAGCDAQEMLEKEKLNFFLRPETLAPQQFLSLFKNKISAKT